MTAADRIPEGLALISEPAGEQRVSDALDAFVADVRQAEGRSVDSLYLFGSRARGDHRPESDVDVAVVYSDASVPDWVRLRTLAGLAFDLLVATGVHIQPHPVVLDQWRAAEPSDFIRRIRTDARPIA